MELHLGLALPTSYPAPAPYVAANKSHCHNKRSFSQLLLEHTCAADQTTNEEEDVIFPTLSLLPSTPAHPNKHGHEEHRTHCCSTITKSDDGEADLVGWPPVNFRRKKLRHDNYGDDDEVGENDHIHMVWNINIDDHRHQYDGHGFSTRSNTLYVKVKMEGVGIARKVDLTMHHSFHTLKQTLMDMFGKCHQQSNSYELAYQDKEGDWLLAEDVSWRSFIRCAQRLKLLKSRRSQVKATQPPSCYLCLI